MEIGQKRIVEKLANCKIYEMDKLDDQIKYWQEEVNKVDFSDETKSLVELMSPYIKLMNLIYLKIEMDKKDGEKRKD